MRFKVFLQHDIMDCGPACVRMTAAHYGRYASMEALRKDCYLNREGVSLLNLGRACEKIGFLTHATRITTADLQGKCILPCILHWDQNHYVVLYRITKKRSGRLVFHIADPAHGRVKMDEETFNNHWIVPKSGLGTALLLEPGEDFYTNKLLATDKTESNLSFFFSYLVHHRKYLLQLFMGLAGASMLTLVFPFLSRILVDEGIRGNNFQLIYLVLFAQLFLFAGQTIIEMVQGWLILHVNIRISLHIISDFLIKLLKLPISFFDAKSIGDISQRINDHHRIETFFTGSLLTTLFSIINILVFSVVLGLYSPLILVIFLCTSIAAVCWVFLFQHRRKQLDYKRFARSKENQDKLYEMITGMQEIKLYGSETPKRREWERLQVQLFRLNLSSLGLEQYQRIGFVFLSQLKNILITFIAARAVMHGSITLGTMLSISYIIGQTNGPLEQLIAFVKAAQDARLSLQRMQEIHEKRNEESEDPIVVGAHHAPMQEDIILRQLSFQYEGPSSPYILKDIDLVIPEGKVTAIVGASGSGKTTLLKLLLNFYDPVAGSISVGDRLLSELSPHEWRMQCGTVMQDGYIFSDTIAANIALDGQPVNEKKLKYAVEMANLTSFIDELPLGFNTKIGNNGVGISGGQRQRIFIARAIYKNPHYLFFDEATSSLDANNERTIIDNLQKFFQGRTVLIIAHRLSTVRNADQIIVLDKGRIIETGCHRELVQQKNYYYKLVKNQLELDD